MKEKAKKKNWDDGNTKEQKYQIVFVSFQESPFKMSAQSQAVCGVSKKKKTRTQLNKTKSRS